MDNTLYSYSPIVERPPLRLPDNARVAFYIALNVEYFQVDRPSTSIFPGTAALVPDPLNFGWRDYGVRVGIWRMIEALDRFGLRASVTLNADCCAKYPQIIAAGKERGWAWLAHGKTNSILHTGMAVEQERAFLRDVVQTLAAATGTKINGWLGPALTETFETPKLLRELGLTYLMDWCADDQPFRLNVDGMISVPYSLELNDITMFLGRRLSGADFCDVVIDQFDRLYQEGKDSGRVMALSLHPFIINQPFRQKYLEKALAYITGHSDVWLTTSDEIAAHYIAENKT